MPLAIESEKYFTGIPCKNGHTTYRYSKNNRCIRCCEISYKKSNAKRKHLIPIQLKKRRLKNLGKFREYGRNKYYKNRSKVLVKQKEYKAKNREKEKSRKKIYYNNHKFEYLARCRLRQALLIKRTPVWANKEKINAVYLEREIISQSSGILHHVDHIIPLKGKNVSGLHVETNLQIIPAKDNFSKNNKFIPEYFDFVAQQDRASAF